MHKRSRGDKPRTVTRTIQLVVKRELNAESPDFKSGALTTGPRCLLQLFKTHCFPGGGGVLPYMGYIGMCRCEGYGFQAVYSSIGYINQSV